jgi:outer membrane protein TolC
VTRRKPLRRCTAGIAVALTLSGIDAKSLAQSFGQPAEVRTDRNPSEQRDESDLLVSELTQLQQRIKENARPFSLDQAVETGIANNPQLLVAFSSIQQFEWQLIAAKRQWYPTFALSNGEPFFGYQWQAFVQRNYGRGSSAINSGTKSRTLSVQPGANINWNFLDPTRQPNINAASQALQQQKLLFDVSARNLILTIQTNYFNAQSSQQLINSFYQIYAINKQQLETLEAQRKIGMVTVLEVEQTRSQLFAQLSQLVSYTNNLINQSALLAESLGLPDGSLAIPSEDAAMQGDWLLPLKETITRATQQREEIQASLAAAEAAEWNSIAAIRSYLPVFSFMGSGSLVANNGYQEIPIGADPGALSGPSQFWNGAAGIGFTWSIFDGGIQAANAQAAKAIARQQTAQANQNSLNVVQQVRSSYAQLETSQVAMKSARLAYKSAELAQEAARARFAVGIGDITSVVQTIDQLSNAATQVSLAMLDYNTAVAQLYRFSATWPGMTAGELRKRRDQLRNPQPQSEGP